jgi:hypothetical protein
VLLDQEAADGRARRLQADLAPLLTWRAAVNGLLDAMPSSAVGQSTAQGG